MNQQYISPISTLIGANSPLNYQPLEVVENVNLNIDKQDGSGMTPISIWEFLAYHIDQHLKLPIEVRQVLLQVIDPRVSISKRLELPFRTSQNDLAVECFYGNKRILVFNDPAINDLVRCVEIPYNNSDPENYLTSVNIGAK